MQDLSELIIVPGSAHPTLAAAVARFLDVPATPVDLERFPDGEVRVRLVEPIAGRVAIIIQPTGPPVDAHLVELLALVDACRRADAGRVIAVVPYFGYARGDRRHGRQEPIMASLAAQLLQAAGVARLITVDLHAPQIEGFFQIPVDDLSPFDTLLTAVRPALPADVAIVSPDLGRLGLATRYADELRTTAVVVQKRRLSGLEAQPLQLVGDVRDRACLIVDDMITTGGTVAGCVEVLLAAGARPEILVAATHGLFVHDAAVRLAHPAIRKIWVTDTLPQSGRTPSGSQAVGIAPLLAASIARARTLISEAVAT